MLKKLDCSFHALLVVYNNPVVNFQKRTSQWQSKGLRDKGFSIFGPLVCGETTLPKLAPYNTSSQLKKFGILFSP